MSQNRRNSRSRDAALQESEQMIAGRNPVLEALRSEMLPDTVYLSGNGGVLRQISELAKEKGIPVKMVSDAIIEALKSAIENKIIGEWRHEGGVLGISAEHINVEIDGKEYTVIEVKEIGFVYVAIIQAA